MNSTIDDLLDHVDNWKLKLHDQLKRMTPLQRKAFWQQLHDQARTSVLPVVEPMIKAKQPTKRARRTG